MERRLYLVPPPQTWYHQYHVKAPPYTISAPRTRLPMKLSRFSDLGLRALMVLGARPERVSAREISDLYGVSKDHVMKSLQSLERSGFVDSTPGRGGGFKLVADPETLLIGDVVQRLEPSLALAECFEPGNTRCPLTGDCVLSTALGDGLRAFLNALNQYSLADLVQGQRPFLVQLVDARA